MCPVRSVTYVSGRSEPAASPSRFGVSISIAEASSPALVGFASRRGCASKPHQMHQNQQASSLVHSASSVQPARMKYSASAADISTMRSVTVRCWPEKVCADPTSKGARRRTRRSGCLGVCSAASAGFRGFDSALPAGFRGSDRAPSLRYLRASSPIRAPAVICR